MQSVVGISRRLLQQRRYAMPIALAAVEGSVHVYRTSCEKGFCCGDGASAAEKKALVAMGLPSTRYCIGVAPTSKGLCRECRDAIEEGSLRFGIEHRFGAHYEARWRHWECTKVCDFQNALSLAQGGWSKVPGFNDISAAEQKVVLSTKLPGKSTAPAKFRQLKKRPAKACRNNELTASCGTSSKFRRLAKKPAGTRDPVIDLA
eukprot:gnl/TRDRNA2_/TRDRNA2_164076_c0_seq2.p1 gnl/TRDRNA2_/TRDRNA2_164076_c0~~gnl/TRDRNA2_/TRDRNA2_164076_c0_seq2.p1  ORF type:complete len:204 (-),score=27.45 gnl/TRDRNA2_/TRDRNA2_164076_c0_seq2:340-951(-)